VPGPGIGIAGAHGLRDLRGGGVGVGGAEVVGGTAEFIAQRREPRHRILAIAQYVRAELLRFGD
jgi:hypothetical protein